MPADICVIIYGIRLRSHAGYIIEGVAQFLFSTKMTFGLGSNTLAVRLWDIFLGIFGDLALEGTLHSALWTLDSNT